MITREKALDVLRTHAIECPPRRFAVCEIVPDGDGFDGALIAWGIASEERVDVYSVQPGRSGHFGSMATLSFLFGESCEIVWVDPEPSE